jgi:linoleoyl-CoA desaturase
MQEASPLIGRGLKVKFPHSEGFHKEVKDRVNRYFITTGLKPRGLKSAYFKTVLLLAWLLTSYVLLVFVARHWWQSVPLSLSLGMAMAGVGFNLPHEAGHEAYSSRRFINSLVATTLDLIGGSSYCWKWKHNFIHHTYTNISGADDDIDIRPLLHLTPGQPRRWLHRYQHLYVWLLYCLLPLRWYFYADFAVIYHGEIGGHKIPRPRGWDLLILLGGKALFFYLAFVLPLTAHGFWAVVIFYLLASFTSGLLLSVLILISHCVQEAKFPTPLSGTNRMETEWAVHQVETTVGYARGNRLLTWYLGGLNFPIEHHLFPQICHVHYPALAGIVESVCAEYDVKYFAHNTLLSALVSHYRFLRIDKSQFCRRGANIATNAR